MRSSASDAPPAQVPAARPAALTVRLAGLASYTAEIAAAILGCLPF